MTSDSRASDNEPYMVIERHSPERSYSVPSTHVTVSDPASARAVSWINDLVSSAMSS